MTASLFTQSEGDEALCQKISSQNTDTSWHRHSEYHFVLGDTWELPVDFSWLTVLTGSLFRLVAGVECIECILVNTGFRQPDIMIKTYQWELFCKARNMYWHDISWHIGCEMSTEWHLKVCLLCFPPGIDECTYGTFYVMLDLYVSPQFWLEISVERGAITPMLHYVLK